MSAAGTVLQICRREARSAVDLAVPMPAMGVMAKRVLRYRKAMGLPFLRIGLAVSVAVFATVIGLHDAWCWSAYQRWLDRLEPRQEVVRDLVTRRNDVLRRHWLELQAARRVQAEVAAQDHAETAWLVDQAARRVGGRRRSALQRQLAETMRELASARQREWVVLEEGDRLPVPVFWGRAAVIDRPGPVPTGLLPVPGRRVVGH